MYLFPLIGSTILTQKRPISYQNRYRIVDLIRDPSANIAFWNFGSCILVDVKMSLDKDYWLPTKTGNNVTVEMR